MSAQNTDGVESAQVVRSPPVAKTTCVLDDDWRFQA